MAMIDQNSANASPLDEELVAYLDGELDADAARRIEALLASDPEVRARLQSLERTWELLDELDETPVGDPFTRSTLEMVAVAAQEDLDRSRRQGTRRRGMWFYAACLAAAAAAGFAAVFALAPDPNRRLLEDLPILENFDEYRQAHSIEYLHKLRAAGLFVGEGNGPPAPFVGDGGDLDARRRRVESMSLDAKRELRRTEERFRSLPPGEQQNLRRLHEELLADPDAEAIRRVLRGYCEWLGALSSYSQAELAELKPDERVAWVKKRLEAEQRREGGKRLGAKDMEAVREWLAAFVARNETKLLASLTEQQRKWLAEIKGDQTRRHIMLGQMWQRWMAAEQADLAELRGRLSRETQRRLDDKPPAEQWKIIAGWLRQGLRRPGDDRRPPGPLARDDDERLADFFENELSDDERDRLLAMPGEEMQRELLRLFLTRARPPERPPGRRMEDPRRGPWPDRPTPPKKTEPAR